MTRPTEGEVLTRAHVARRVKGVASRSTAAQVASRRTFYYTGDKDLEKLRRFVDDTRAFLGRLVKHRRAFVPELHEHVRRAWIDAAKHFDELVSRLDVCEEELDRHGLTGHQLNLKLANVQHWFGELIASRATGCLGRLLQAINNLLDSVLQACALPGAAKELKDAIRDALKPTKER